MVKKLGSVPGSKSHQPQENDFVSCLSTYFGPEVSRIKDAVDDCCQNVLQDFLSFLESPNAHPRLKDLVPYVHNMCYGSLSTILMQLKHELDSLYGDLENKNKDDASKLSPAILIERSLFIGRLLFAFQKHARHISVVLGSPRSWVGEVMKAASSPSPIGLRHTRATSESEMIDSPGRRMLDPGRKQASLVTSTLFGTDDRLSSQLQELHQTTQDLCIRAYNLWISWISDELSTLFSRNLNGDEALSSTDPVKGWEETVVKQQEQSGESESEMKISLPSMPSLYVASFLFYACEEIHCVGGHVLDKPILQNFARRLFHKVVRIYEDLMSAEEGHGSQVSDKGVLQVLFDLKFAADILSGGNLNANEEFSETANVKSPFRRKQKAQRHNSVVGEHTKQLINRISQRLDPIDWLTYEPYLWENERQAYLRHAVLFGFFVQLNRMHLDTVQKLPTNSESNIMRCSTVSRFKYLPISAPALSARNAVRTCESTSMDDVYSRNSWKNLTSDVDEDSRLGVAAPFLKSFMQVGSRFGESIRLGSMLTDGHVGRFGDMLPAQAAGLLSSFTAARSDS